MPIASSSPTTSRSAATAVLAWPARIAGWLSARHPVTQLALAALVARSVALVRHYLGVDLLGLPIAVEPGRFLPWALPYHIGVLLAVAAPLVLLAQAHPRAHKPVLGTAALVFGFLVLYGQVDLELLRGLGTHLTPSFIGQHFGAAMFTDIADGLHEDLPHLLGSAAIVLSSWVAMVLIWRRHRRAAQAPTLRLATSPWPRHAALPALATLGIAFPHLYNWSSNRLRVVVPPEVLFVRHLVDHDRAPAPADPQAAIQRLHAFLGGERRPVEAQPASAGAARPPVSIAHLGPAPRASARPDIFVIVVESLRARELFDGFEVRPDFPSLRAIAARAVTFPQFLSNGFPSAAGFFSLNCSGWPHPEHFILSDFAAHGFDCLPARLARHGWDTAFFSASNPSMDNQLPWARRLYRVVRAGDVRTHDRKLFDDFLEWLGERDASAGDKPPLFAWIATASTHHPFIVNDPEYARTDAKDLLSRYRDALRYADGQIGRLVSALESRSVTSGREAVIVIVGDHAFPVDEPAGSPELEAQGCDRRVWTGAILLGPEALVGPPRVLSFPASQVDLMPTIMAMIGDSAPTATLGRDLLDGDARGRHAVVVTHGGLRLDLDDVSIFTSLDGQDTWSESRLDQAGCTPLAPAEAGAFERARELAEQVRLWSWLVETNRVWRD